MEKVIEPAEDSIRIYRLCAECDVRQEFLGLGVRTDDPEVYVV
jgi:CRISPR/Cas system-associated endoribonuclease Cas2